MTKISDTAVRFYDGMKNVLSGLGTGRDSHAAGSAWYNRPMSQPEIEAAYRTSWLAKKIHDVPPTDMIAPWRVWQATPDQVTAIEKEERRLGLKKRVRKAMIFARMYGGSAIMMGIAGDDPSQPLDLNRVKLGGLSYLHVLTRHEVTVSGIDMDPGSSTYGEPLAYMVNGGGNMVSVHPTRMVRFTFGDLPDQLAFSESSWGDPLMTSLRDAIANADTAQGNFAALTSKALTSTLSTPGLLDIVSTAAGEQKFIEKTRVMQAFRSMFNLNIVAGPSKTGDLGETLTDTSFSFANVPQMGSWFIQMAAAAASMPMTKLGSISPGGLNSAGDGDAENYIQLLSSGRELDLTPAIQMIDEPLIRSALGVRDEKIYFTWEPFQSESETDKVVNAQGRALAIKTLSDSGTMPNEVLAKIVKAQVIDSGDYPGAEDAYKEFEAGGDDLAEINPPAEPAANDNVLAAATEGMVAAGKSASVAAKDAIALLTDARPMTLYVSRAVTNFADIRAWFEDQGVAVTVPDASGHVTVAYSRQPIDWLTVGADDWGSTNPGLTVQAGGPRLMDVFNGTLVQIFGSSQLSYRHEAILRAGATWDHPDFNPHFSLNYDFGSGSVDGIKPWLGPIELGMERFEEVNDDWSSDDDED